MPKADDMQDTWASAVVLISFSMGQQELEAWGKEEGKQDALPCSVVTPSGIME